MEKLKSKISIEDCDKTMDSKAAFRKIKSYRSDIRVQTMDLPQLRDFMKSKHILLLGLLSFFFLYALRTNPFDKNACWATRWFEAAR
jgi:hypothetical protein